MPRLARRGRGLARRRGLDRTVAATHPPGGGRGCGRPARGGASATTTRQPRTERRLAGPRRCAACDVPPTAAASPECGVAPDARPRRTGSAVGSAGRLHSADEAAFEPPLEPMLAKASDGLPDGDGWLFEPKWDGFRAIVFRDGDEVFIQCARPEAARPLLPGAGRADQRSASGALRRRRRGRHRDGRRARVRGAAAPDPPGGSRVKMLAEETPASLRRLGPARARRRATCARRPRASAPAARGRRSRAPRRRSI